MREDGGTLGLLMGLSHLLQARLWVRFFEAVRNLGWPPSLGWSGRVP